MSQYVIVFISPTPILHEVLNSCIAISPFGGLLKKWLFEFGDGFLQYHVPCKSNKVEDKAIPVEAYYWPIVF